MNLPVPDPILLTNSHDGLDGVRLLSWLWFLLRSLKLHGSGPGSGVLLGDEPRLSRSCSLELGSLPEVTLCSAVLLCL